MVSGVVFAYAAVELVGTAAVLVLMGFDYPIGTWTIATLVIIVPALVIGWRLVRDRVKEIAAEPEGYTGAIPIRPSVRSPRDRHAARTTTTRRRPDQMIG